MALGGRNISAAMLDEMDIDAVSQMPIGDLSEIAKEIEIAAALWKARNDALQAALDTRYGERATALRLAEGKDTGTVHIDDSGLDITCELRKKVEWDQSKLETLSNRIAAAGDDPAVYMQIERKIKEATFSGWPEKVQAAFSPARTVKPERPKYVFSDPVDKTKPKGRGKS